jgi:hypothetical protein
MFRGLGYASVSVSPLVVFILEGLEATIRVTIPVQLLVGIYPLGMLILVIYCLAFKQGMSIDHYLEFANGARTGAFLVLFGSFIAVFFPIFFGEPSLGSSLALISLGSVWLPSASAAGVFGASLIDPRTQRIPAFKGTTHNGIAAMFLAFFLRYREPLDPRWPDVITIILLGFLYVLGWVLLSITGGFPATLLGLSLTVLVPVSSYRLFTTVVKRDDYARIRDILISQSSTNSR